MTDTPRRRPGRPPGPDRAAITIRLPEDVHRRLHDAAAERDLSANHLASRAIADYLDRLIPLDEWKWTR